MQKKLTILFAFAIFVLVVGWAITPTKAHANHCDKKPEHKHCNGEPVDDGNVVSAITFTVTGDLEGVECQEDVPIKNGTHVLSTSTNLTGFTFFRDIFDDRFGNDAGTNCFPEDSYLAFFQLGKIGGIDPQLAFYPSAKTIDGDAVGYNLQLTDSMDSSFVVPQNGEIETFVFDSWEMKANGQNSHSACKGEGVFSFANVVTVEVARNDENFCD